MRIHCKQPIDIISERSRRAGRLRRWPDLKFIAVLSLGIIFVAAFGGAAYGQRNSAGFMITGDVKVDESKATEPGPTVLDVILYTEGMQVVGRQRITPNGRYRFDGVRPGQFYLVIEMENVEVTRTTVMISATSPSELRQDFGLEWRGKGKPAGGVVSAADLYDRSAANKALYKRSTQAIETKNYKDAIATLQQVVAADKGDYPAWSDLGMLYFIQKDYENADKSYAGSLAAKPDYFPALLSQGRVKMAKADLEGAVASLEAAVKLDPKSASANFFLGEAYLQMKKGSKAVVYMNEAVALDPVGMADAHLRLAALYNGAKMTDKAAAEYEAFLKVKPDYPDKKKLEEYITANKKP